MLLFTDTNCIKLSFDIEDLSKTLVDTLNWEIKDDSLRIFSSKEKHNFRIVSLNSDSLVLDQSIYSNLKHKIYHSFKSSNTEQSIGFIKSYFLNNSFKAKSSISEKVYLYDFTDHNKCINKLDSVNFQL